MEVTISSMQSELRSVHADKASLEKRCVRCAAWSRLAAMHLVLAHCHPLPAISHSLTLYASLASERSASADASTRASARVVALEKDVSDKGAALDDLRRRLRNCDGERVEALSNLKRAEVALTDAVASHRREKVCCVSLVAIGVVAPAR